MGIKFKFFVLSLVLVLVVFIYLLISYRQGWMSYNVFAATTLVVLLAFATLLSAFWVWVEMPLRLISRSLNQSRPDLVKDILSRSDEFGLLARLIQQAREQLSQVEFEIKRRQEMELALRVSQDAYQTMVDHSIQGLAILQHGRLVFANSALSNDLGYSIDELTAFTWQQVREIIHPTDLLMAIEHIQQCLLDGQGQQFELRVLRKDKTWSWFQVLANKVIYQGERAIQLANLDVTGRKKAEQALQHEQAFAHAILHTVNSLVIVLDPTGRVVRCNPACERATGFPLDQVQGRFFWDLLDSEAENAAIKARYLNLVESQTVMHLESQIVLSSGQRFWVSWLNAFLLDDDSEVQYVVVSGVDVTERIQRERQQQAIAALSSHLKGFLSREQTFQLILEQTQHFLHADVVALSLVRPEHQQIVVEAALGMFASEVVHLNLSSDAGVSGQVIRTRRAFMTNQLAQDAPLLPPAMLEILTSGAWIPLEVEGGPIGLLMVGNRHPIRESDFQLLLAVADVAAGAVQRSLLTEETQRRLQRLSALHTINIAVSASLDIRVTLSVLVNQITTQLGVDACDIFLIDPLTHNLVFTAGHGFHSREHERKHMWLGEGRTGQVAMERKSLHLYNPNGIAADFTPARQFGAENFVAYDAVPLIIKGEIKGVLETFHREPYEPDLEWLQFLEALATETSIAINNAELLDKLQRSNLDLALAYDATIEGWALALEMRDRVTEGHTRRVAEWTMHLARAFKVSSEELVHIRRGSLLHDIGKMSIPDSILNKPGPLTEEEWEIMRKHPQHAFEMLSSIPFLRPAIAIPYSHHERWDGSGYPQGLAGKQIPLPARIFAVVDVWDAIFFGRRYRDPMPEEYAIAYLEEEAGRLFDPDVVKAFVEVRRIVNLAERNQPG